MGVGMDVMQNSRVDNRLMRALRQGAEALPDDPAGCHRHITPAQIVVRPHQTGDRLFAASAGKRDVTTATRAYALGVRPRVLKIDDGLS